MSLVVRCLMFVVACCCLLCRVCCCVFAGVMRCLLFVACWLAIVLSFGVAGVVCCVEVCCLLCLFPCVWSLLHVVVGCRCVLLCCGGALSLCVVVVL